MHVGLMATPFKKIFKYFFVCYVWCVLLLSKRTLHYAAGADLKFDMCRVPALSPPLPSPSLSESEESQSQGRVRKQHARMFCPCLTHGGFIREEHRLLFGWYSRTQP